MLSCKEITQLSSDYIDNELPFLKRWQFRMHLFMCKRCREFVDQIETTISAIKKLQPAPPEEAYINQQVKAILKEHEVQQSNLKQKNKK